MSCFSLGSSRRSGPDIYSSGLLRAALAGEEQSAPQYTVSVSLQQPLEIVLPSLPEFQGAAVSRECFPQFFPPGIVAELRASPHLRGSLEQLLRFFPAGPPFQGIDLAAWKLLPNLSRWVLQTVEKRLSYSVWHSAAAFERSISHISESRAGSGIRTRSDLSLEEGGHRDGPSSQQRVRVLQPVLHCSKEGWGVMSNSRSAAFEPLSHASEVQNAHCQTGHPQLLDTKEII